MNQCCKERIEKLEAEYEFISGYVKVLDSKVISGQITCGERDMLISIYTKDIPVQIYLAKLDQQIEFLEDRQRKYERALAFRKSEIIAAAVILAAAIIFYGINITGSIISGEDVRYIRHLDITEYGAIITLSDLNISDETIKSLRLTGEYYGSFRIYLVNRSAYELDPDTGMLLVYESSDYRPIGITALATGNDAESPEDVPDPPDLPENIMPPGEYTHDDINISDDTSKLFNKTNLPENQSTATDSAERQTEITTNDSSNLAPAIDAGIADATYNDTSSVLTNTSLNTTGNEAGSDESNEAISDIIKPDETAYGMVNETLNASPVDMSNVSMNASEANMSLKQFTDECQESCSMLLDSNDLALLMVVDNSSMVHLTEMAYTLKKKNHAPVQTANFSDVMLDAGGSMTINLSGYFIDPDNDKLIFDRSGASDLVATIENDLLDIHAPVNGTNETMFIYATDGKDITISNTFTVSSGKDMNNASSIETTQYEARVGEPVKWKKRISMPAKEDFLVVSVPEDAENITITDVGDGSRSDITEYLEDTGITQGKPAQRTIGM